MSMLRSTWRWKKTVGSLQMILSALIYQNKIGYYEVDLGAEQVLAAEREGRKVAVEIKSLLGGSLLNQFHEVLGQYLNYRSAMADVGIKREMYLAISTKIYKDYDADSLLTEPYPSVFRKTDHRGSSRKNHSPMDRLNTYHQAIVAEMEYQASIPISNRPNTQRHLVIDPARRRYMLFNVGWDGDDFVHGLLFPLELKEDGMIWLHANFTDIEIGQNLVERGVDPQHIEGS